MRETIDDLDNLKQFLDKMIGFDLPMVFSQVDVRDNPRMVSGLFGDVIGLGELLALHKLIKMIDVDNRHQMFEDSEIDDAFFDVMTQILTSVKDDIIGEIEHKADVTMERFKDQFKEWKKSEIEEEVEPDDSYNRNKDRTLH